MLREMSTTYGRSALGYLWAILEPVAGILLMTLIFSFAFRTPSIGTSFPLFFASGILPFMAYMDISNKVAVSLRFSSKLLFYPGVTYVDAMLARILLNAMTQSLVSGLVITGILVLYSVDVILDIPAIALGFFMTFGLAVAVGTLNCYLLSVYPVWERIWAILNRPMFLISCVLFTFETIPLPYRDWLWWNPLVHIIGQVRSGVYATYDASYVSHLYVFGLTLVLLALGLLLLRRYHRDIIND
nr:ABC transporter permease [Puniceibacterium confluentis]